MEPARRFHLQTKGYDIVAAINRAGAATGSLQGATDSAQASFNGHHLRVDFNTYNAYYIAGYTWSGWQVVFRTADFASAIQSAKDFYAREGLGAGVTFTPRPEDVPMAEADPALIPGDEDVKQAPWWTWKHSLVHSALRDRTTHLLIKAETPEDYDRICAEWRQGLRPAVAAR